MVLVRLFHELVCIITSMILVLLYTAVWLSAQWQNEMVFHRMAATLMPCELITVQIMSYNAAVTSVCVQY